MVNQQQKQITQTQQNQKQTSDYDYDDNDDKLRNISRDIAQMYFKYDHMLEQMANHARMYQFDNGKYRLCKYLCDCYRDNRFELTRLIADNLYYDCDYVMNSEKNKEYDLESEAGQKEFWYDLLSITKAIYEDLCHNNDMLLDLKEHVFHDFITNQMIDCKRHIMRINYIIKHLENVQWIQWALCKTNKEIHDRIECHNDLDFSL